jgi:hypothetical protein
VDNPLGHTLRGEPSWDDLWAKWNGSLLGCNVRKAFDAVRNLESIADTQKLFAAYAGINA